MSTRLPQRSFPSFSRRITGVGIRLQRRFVSLWGSFGGTIGGEVWFFSLIIEWGAGREAVGRGLGFGWIAEESITPGGGGRFCFAGPWTRVDDPLGCCVWFSFGNRSVNGRGSPRHNYLGL